MIMYTCAKCNIEMNCEKNNVAVIHYMNNDKDQGIDVIRIGDLWKCPTCDNEIVLGFQQGQIEYNIKNRGQLEDLKKFYEKENTLIEIRR